MQRRSPAQPRALPSSRLKTVIRQVVARTPIHDIHTHLYDPEFGPLLLWGIDELLTYHYLVAESFRHHHMDYAAYGKLPKTRQAELIWDLLFLKNSPISESCRGVLTSLNTLGLDVKKRDLPLIRRHFAKWSTRDYVDRVFELSGVDRVTMTNNPFDDLERPIWKKGWKRDERFDAALRLDDILMHWPQPVGRLREWGYDVLPETSPRTLDEVRRFLSDWIARTRPVYLAVSLPPTFGFPDPESACARNRLISRAVLPVCQEHGLPFAMMLGVKKLTNPHLGVAGDSVGHADIGVVERMCASWPKNRFLVTMLSRENQHELCVAARKFHNLHVFGCWWFLNNPSLIGEMTRMRIELLGLSMTPQHSDCRVLDQLLYKWPHFREILAEVLVEKYTDIARTGWAITESDIERDVTNLFGGSFRHFSAK